MAKPKGVAAFFEEEDPAALDAKQTGAGEAIEEEMDKYTRMMNDCAGVTDGEVVFWLHRANEKNKALHSSFLKRYPKETPFSEIFEEARDEYGAGDFVLVAKKDDVMFRKMAFSCERPIRKEAPAEKPPEDPFKSMGAAIEKALVIDRAANMMRGNNPPAVEKGVDPTVTVMLTMIQGLQNQNTELLKGMMTRREAPGGNESLLEAIKLGSMLSGGKLPIEEGDGGILDIIKGLGPYVPQIIAMLSGKGPHPATHPPRMPGASPVAPRPLPPAASRSASLPPAMPSGPAEVIEAPPAVAEDPQAVIMRRVVDEVKFVLTLPATPKLREHVIEYIDAYMPDILRQAEIVPAEMFAAYVVTLDPAFAGQEAFFIDLHKQYMAGMEEEPGKSDMGADPAS
jgi:hypothetical protein